MCVCVSFLGDPPPPIWFGFPLTGLKQNNRRDPPHIFLRVVFLDVGNNIRIPPPTPRRFFFFFFFFPGDRFDPSPPPNPPEPPTALRPSRPWRSPGSCWRPAPAPWRSSGAPAPPPDKRPRSELWARTRARRTNKIPRGTICWELFWWFFPYVRGNETCFQGIRKKGVCDLVGGMPSFFFRVVSGSTSAVQRKPNKCKGLSCLEGALLSTSKLL